MIGMNINTKHNIFRICIAIVLLGTFIGGASAAFNPGGYMGTVVGKDSGNNTFEVQTTHNWSDNGPCGEWQPSTAITEWPFPNEDALNEINVGDYVEILGFPEPYGQTIGLGKMNSSTEKVITDIYGDPDFLEPYWPSEPLDPPLLGNFTIKYSSTPNCSDCGMCNCEANYTEVTIIDEAGQVEIDDHQLYPGQTCTYGGMEYRINITFYSGEAPACPVCNDSCPPGPQPISNFTIRIKTVNQPPAIPRGDLNHDGEVTSADAVIALQIAVSGEFVEEADIDENGCVNALDARMILQAAAGNIEI
jgi:hypothetical protein